MADLNHIRMPCAVCGQTAWVDAPIRSPLEEPVPAHLAVVRCVACRAHYQLAPPYATRLREHLLTVQHLDRKPMDISQPIPPGAITNATVLLVAPTLVAGVMLFAMRMGGVHLPEAGTRLIGSIAISGGVAAAALSIWRHRARLSLLSARAHAIADCGRCRASFPVSSAVSMPCPFCGTLLATKHGDWREQNQGGVGDGSGESRVRQITFGIAGILVLQLLAKLFFDIDIEIDD